MASRYFENDTGISRYAATKPRNNSGIEFAGRALNHFEQLPINKVSLYLHDSFKIIRPT